MSSPLPVDIAIVWYACYIHRHHQSQKPHYVLQNSARMFSSSSAAFLDTADSENATASVEPDQMLPWPHHSGTTIQPDQWTSTSQTTPMEVNVTNLQHPNPDQGHGNNIAFSNLQSNKAGSIFDPMGAWHVDMQLYHHSIVPCCYMYCCCYIVADRLSLPVLSSRGPHRGCCAGYS